MTSSATSTTTARHQATTTESDEDRKWSAAQSASEALAVLMATLPNPLHWTVQDLLARLEALPRRMIHHLVVPMAHHNHNSSTVQRVLRHQDSYVNIAALKQKYSKELRADAELQVLTKQIKAQRQQLQQQRLQRERMDKRHAAQRERDQKCLEQSTLKLKQAIEATMHKNANRREYIRALARAGNHPRKFSGTGSSLYNKLSLTPSSSSPTMEKEAVQLEISILKNLHRTQVHQSQSDLAERYGRSVVSALKQERAVVEQERAELVVFQMVLDGIHRALAGLYPEILWRQGLLLQRMLRKLEPIIADHPSSSGSGSHSGATLPIHTAMGVPRVISSSPAILRTGNPPPRSGLSFDGISDLGESLIADSITETESIEQYYGRPGGPVFTSVHALQQSTLQQMAGVQSF